MAEGGYDPDETGTFDPNEGADEKTPLNHHDGEEIGMKDRTSTPFSSTSKHRTRETSFMGEKTPSGKIIFDVKNQEKTEIIARLNFFFVDPKPPPKFRIWIDDYDRVIANLGRKGSKDYEIINSRGELAANLEKLPKEMRKAFGKTNAELGNEKIAENTERNKEAEERIKELREQRENAFPEDRVRIDGEIEREEEGINERNQENEILENRKPLRERIKDIFKKHGFTAFAVMTAIATVIGVIVSNLKAGLTKVAKGVGNGLKELGKKLGEILPGMIGAIASFIFRTAGEVIGFLAKNAWLLIVGLVLFAVEQLKNKKK